MQADIPPPLDSRVPITLDLHVGKIYLRDRFEWDLSSDLEPETFASILVKELGLSSEFETLISHSIREQIYKLKLEGDSLAMNPFALESRLRGEEEARTWCPLLMWLKEEDLEKLDRGQDRRAR
jgi:chromatin structure-remodeling complex subunit SFH1